MRQTRRVLTCVGKWRCLTTPSSQATITLTTQTSKRVQVYNIVGQNSTVLHRIAAQKMFKNTFQSGFLSILYSIGSKPLQIWDKKVSFKQLTHCLNLTWIRNQNGGHLGVAVRQQLILSNHHRYSNNLPLICM